MNCHTKMNRLKLSRTFPGREPGNGILPAKATYKSLNDCGKSMPMATKKDIGELLKQRDLVAEAIRQGGREAMKQYIQAGQPMVSWQDGEIVKIPPAELQKMLDNDA